MARTVRVRLELDRADYKEGLRAAANDTRTFDGEVQTLGDHAVRTGVELKGVDAAAKQLGDDVKKSSRDADGLSASVKKVGDESVKTKQRTTELGGETGKTSTRMQELAREIDLTSTAVKELSSAWVKTRDADVGPMLRDQQEHLRSLRAEYEKAKLDADKISAGGGLLGKIFGLGGKTFDNSEIPSLLGKEGSLGGTAFGEGFMGALKPFAGPAALAFGIPLVAELGAVVSGAILGGLGLTAIGAAIALQFNNPQVHGAITGFGAYVKQQLDAATLGFVPSIVSGIDALKRESEPLWASLRQGFQSLEPYAANLLVRLGEGLAKLGPGLSQAMSAAGPIVERIAADLPMLLGSIGDFFSKISQGAKGAGEAIDLMMHVASIGFSLLGNLLLGLSNAFDFLIQGADKIFGVLAKIPGMSAVFGPIHDYVDGIAHSMDGMGISADSDFGKVKSGASEAAQSIQQANAASQALLGTWMSADQATIALSQSMNALKDSVKQNGTALEGNSAKALANQSAILAVVQAAEQKRQADIAAGASTDFANRKYADSIGALRAAAIAAFGNTAAVDGMIGKYRQVPGDVSTRVTINGVDTAIERILSVKSALNSLQNKTVTTTVIQNTVTGETRKTVHAGPAFNRYGGVYEHAATGLLREADSFSAKSPGRYMIAEPATRGEAFVPKNGNYGRSMSILDKAAGWYGERVTRGGGAVGGSSATYVTNVNLTVSAGLGANGGEIGQQIIDKIRPVIDRNGGNVQMAIVGRQVS